MAVVGAALGGGMSLLGKGTTAIRQKIDPSYRPTLPPPSASTAAVGLGGFMAISSNFRFDYLHHICVGCLAPYPTSHGSQLLSRSWFLAIDPT